MPKSVPEIRPTVSCSSSSVRSRRSGSIVDCVRRQKARADLLDTDLPLAGISGRLGFAEPAVLSRCARRW
jgi:AraC-like DNA-binding protein